MTGVWYKFVNFDKPGVWHKFVNFGWKCGDDFENTW